MLKKLLLLVFGLSAGFAFSQTGKTNDLADPRPERYALTHATVHADPSSTIQDATILISENRIVSVIAGAEVPKGYQEIDLTGKHVYPGLRLRM